MDKETFESAINNMIPYLLILLLFVIIIEIFIHPTNETVIYFIHLIDYSIILIFILDLYFLWQKSKDIRFFFKNYWLDIIAVFPFAIFFKAVSRFTRFALQAEKIAIGQAIIHETSRAGRVVELFSKSELFAKYLRISARVLRVFAKSRLFERFRCTYYGKCEELEVR